MAEQPYGGRCLNVLYDIGANVGIYSVYAAAVRGARCFSFEPDSGNFALLCSNILLNNLSGRVIPYCMGALDRSGITTLHARKGAAGGSGHSVGYAVDSSLRPVKTGFEQGIYSIRIEDFAAREDGLPPTMIKIDVDGLEHLVVEGLGRLLNSPSLRGINIELSDKLVQHDHVRERLSASGFSVDEDLSFLHPNGSSRNLIFTRD
ncbi:FkbM family methyltransferase [Nisaea sp.]|uniref:FkbM family methyltransferase n=1 Tax=Nisaea sp. TaxID=2024842 RepID=UPI003B519B26